MELITSTYVKTHFPLWSRYCIAANNQTADEILQGEIDMAQNDLLDYVAVDETTITDQFRLHLFNIIKYRLFGLKHGDTEFQADPQIVKDYKYTRDVLMQYKKGQLSVDAAPSTGPNRVTIKGKHRLFDHGFGPCNPGDEEHKRGLL